MSVYPKTLVAFYQQGKGGTCSITNGNSKGMKHLSNKVFFYCMYLERFSILSKIGLLQYMRALKTPFV